MSEPTVEQIRALWSAAPDNLTGRELMAALNEPLWDGHAWTDAERNEALARCAALIATKETK